MILQTLQILAQSQGPVTPYRPFLDPLPLHDYWWALLPLMSLFIALAYKAVRERNLSKLPWAVLEMTFMIVAGMLLLGLASYLLVEKFLPFIRHAP